MSESDSGAVVATRVSDFAAVEHRLITCILPKGQGVPAQHALSEKFGNITANINYARGVGRAIPLRHRGVGEQSEKEILSVVVTASEADAVFEFLYFEARVDRPHGGIVYMSGLAAASAYALPALPREV